MSGFLTAEVAERAEVRSRGTVGIEGLDNGKLSGHLFKKHRIVVTPITHDDFAGIRVTPDTYTTLRELDLFCEAMEEVITSGLPA